MNVRARLGNLVPKHGFSVPPLANADQERDQRAAADWARGHGSGCRPQVRNLPSTAREHVEKAKMKLEVSTLAEAIAIAVSLADRGALKTTGLRLLSRNGGRLDRGSKSDEKT